MQRKLIASLVLAAASLGSGFANANGGTIGFDEPYWKENLTSIKGREAFQGTSFQAVQVGKPDRYSFLTDYNP